MSQDEVKQRIAAVDAALDIVDGLRYSLDSKRVPEYPETHPFGWRDKPEWFVLFRVKERYLAELEYLNSLVRDEDRVDEDHNTVAWALQEYGL